MVKKNVQRMKELKIREIEIKKIHKYEVVK